MISLTYSKEIAGFKGGFMNLFKMNDYELANGMPSDKLTETDWNTMFNIIKLETHKAPEHRYSARTSVPRNSGDYDDNVRDMSETQWFRYRQYINSVLSSIRSGDSDFCYYIYQIKDLLRFEPNLKSRYLKNDK